MKKNFVYNVILSLTNILFPILTFPYAAHILGPEGIGKVQFTISFAQYFSLFAALGIPLYGISETAKHKNDRQRLSQVFSELLLIYLLATIIVSLFYLAIIYTVPLFNSDSKLYLNAGIIVFLGFTSIDWLYSGIEKFKVIALRSMLIKVISVLLLYQLVNDKTDYNRYLLVIVFSLLGNNLISFLMVGKYVNLSFSDLQLKRHIKPLLFILGTGLAASIYTVLDTVLLGFLSDDRSVGLYTAAVKLSKICIPLIVSIGTVFIPVISRLYANSENEQLAVTLNRSFSFICLIAVPVSFGLFLLAPEFIIVFSGEKFLPATSSMRTLSFLPLLVGFGHLFSFQMLVPFGQGARMFYASLGGVVCCILLNLILVPFLSEQGAAIASISSELVVTSLYFLFLKSSNIPDFKWSLLSRSICCCLIFIPIIFLLRAIGDVYLFLLLSVVCCSAGYFLAQYFIFKNLLVASIFQMIRAKIKNGSNG